MKILVTGGTGFVGRHLVWHLSAKGYQVVFTGRRSQAAKQVLDLCPKTSVAAQLVRWLPLEHGTPEAAQHLAEAAVGANAIVHCAALSSPWGRAEDFYRSNLASTLELVGAAEGGGVKRLVHISTPSIYFDFRDRLGICETDPLPAPVNTYANTKAQAEQIVMAANVPQRVILRPRAIFGPWDNTLMPRLLRVLERGAIPLMRGGRAQLDLTYIDNLIHAIDLALHQPLPQVAAIYNLSNAEPLPLVDLLNRVAQEFHLPLRTRHLPWPLVSGAARLLELVSGITKREPLLTRYSAAVLAFSQTLNINAIQQDLGYSTQVSLVEGIRRHAQWYLAQASQRCPL